MIKNAPFGARFLMKSGSGNEEIVTGAQITQGEGYANAQAFAGVAETGGICRIAEQARQASPRREGYANAQAFAGVAEKRVGWHFRKKMTEGAHFARFSPSTAKAVPPQRGRLKRIEQTNNRSFFCPANR